MTKFYFIGDTHGRREDVLAAINQCQDATENDYAIICGDFGAEYGTFKASKFKKAWSKFPGKVLVLRGNHDTRYWRDHTEISETYSSYVVRPLEGWDLCDVNGNTESPDPNLLFQKKYDNIYYIRDEGGIYSIGGKTFLFIPGAYSVDKDYRLGRRMPYEYDEQLSFIEQRQLLGQLEQFVELGYGHINYVVSHTCPICLEPYIRDLFLDFLSQERIDKSTERFLDSILQTLDAKFDHWYFGHYHDDRTIMGRFTMLYNTVKVEGE